MKIWRRGKKKDTGKCDCRIQAALMTPWGLWSWIWTKTNQLGSTLATFYNLSEEFFLFFFFQNIILWILWIPLLKDLWCTSSCLWSCQSLCGWTLLGSLHLGRPHPCSGSFQSDLSCFLFALPKASTCPMWTFASTSCSCRDVADPLLSYFLTWLFPKLAQVRFGSLSLCNSCLREYISGSSKNF